MPERNYRQVKWEVKLKYRPVLGDILRTSVPCFLGKWRAVLGCYQSPITLYLCLNPYILSTWIMRPAWKRFAGYDGSATLGTKDSGYASGLKCLWVLKGIIMQASSVILGSIEKDIPVTGLDVDVWTGDLPSQLNAAFCKDGGYAILYVN